MHHRSDQLITVRDKGGTYLARFRGKTASCTWSAGHAAQSAAAKALGHPVTVRCLDSHRLYQIVISPAPNDGREVRGASPRNLHGLVRASGLGE